MARLARAFLGDGAGATAVEFALIAPPFLALVCAIIETGLFFFAGQILDTRLNEASRVIYTGSFQGQNPEPSGSDKSAILSKVRQGLCYQDGDVSKGRAVTIFDCDSVKLDVLTFSQFTGSQGTNPVNAQGNWDPAFGTRYTAPKANDIVIVQAAVKFPVFSTLLNPSQAAFSDGSRVLRSTVAFRTEPYQ